MADRDRAIEKIKKCLALAKSSNEHEAAAALRQAQAMMRQHDVTDIDLLSSEVRERSSRAGASRRPAQWEALLASSIAKAFGCHIYLSKVANSRRTGYVGEWSFVGCGSGPEVAKYAFDVLVRQLRNHRLIYIREQLQRCARQQQLRRADNFCLGWVLSVEQQVEAFAAGEANEKAIAAYVASQDWQVAERKAETTDRNKGKPFSARDKGDFILGRIAGCDAALHRGVGAVQRDGLERKAS